MSSEAARVFDEEWLYHPPFPAHWERRSLYSLAKWVNGLAFRDIHFSPVGKPIIKIAEIKAGVSAQTKFTEQSFDESVRIRSGDLLFSWSGQPETSIDVFWWRGPEGWLNQHIFRVAPRTGIVPEFFFYLLRYLRPNFIAIARNKQTTGLGHVTKRDIENIRAAYPDETEQRAIAHILGTLDDKIELNRSRNETLEVMVRALFQDWFVDFGPVRAKMEGREPYLPADLWQLFPDRLDEEDKPDGWSSLPFGELLEGSIGGDWGKEQADGDHDQAVCIIRGTDMPDLISGSVGKVPTRFTTRKKLESRLLEDGDIVVEVSGGSPTQPTGRSLQVTTSMLDRFRHPVVCASFCRRLRPKDISLGILAACHMTNLYRSGGTWKYQNQSTGIANFQTTHFLEAERVLVPDSDVLGAFVDFIEPIRAKAASNESIYLAQLRDMLLTKLISGELRIKDAERFMEERAA
ncbi:restriction endonuclease subunit S [Frateuria sp. YIM B11624]|uniref:restriction endonuclease subunit S n=1 Tax=Frateuria sp. YIM B11624 TaxID=3143185 RepID=UPI003C739009